MLDLNLACLFKTSGLLSRTLHSYNSLQLLHKTYEGREALGMDGIQSWHDQDRDIYFSLPTQMQREAKTTTEMVSDIVLHSIM